MRTVGTVCAIVLAPTLLLHALAPIDELAGEEMRRALLRSSREAAQMVRVDAPEEDLRELAEDHRVWIRSFDARKKHHFDVDGTGGVGWIDWLLFAPDPVPGAAGWDREQPEVAERAVVKRVRNTGESAGACSIPMPRTLTICEYATLVQPVGDGPKVLVYALSVSPRGLAGLYDERSLLTKMLVMILGLAAILGAWLAWQIERPVRRLREAVVARTTPVVSTVPLSLEGEVEIVELTEAFNALLGALAQRERANEAFMADMAHEVKNPLAAIRAAADLLDRKELTPQRAERISRILNDSSRRLDAVVTHFLELARAESGLPQEQRVEVRVEVLVNNLVQSFAHDPRAEAITIHAEVEPARVWAVSEALETALRNLIANAISFAETKVEVRARRAGDRIRIEVEDDGPGIAEADHEKVFERFYTRREAGGGTGLGLSMVRAIAQAHGGRAWVESTPGEGATFLVELPALRGIEVGTNGPARP